MKISTMNILFAFLIASAIFPIALRADSESALLPNGHFEHGPKPYQMQGTRVIKQNAIPYWRYDGHIEYIKSGMRQGNMVLVVPQGYGAVRLGKDAYIATTVNVRKGMFYALSFSAARTCGQEERLNVSTGASRGPKPIREWSVLSIQTVYSSDGWDSYSWGFVAKYDQMEINIRNPLSEKDPGCGPLIDSVALLALPAPTRQRGNMLKNGNFEIGPYIFPYTSYGVLMPPNVRKNHSPLPGWIFESTKAVKYIDSAHFAVPEGKRAVELLAGRESSITQVARTRPGQLYLLSFSIGDARNSCLGPMSVQVTAGSAIQQVTYQSRGAGGFKRFTIRFTAGGLKTRLSFMSSLYHRKSDKTGALCGPVVDDVRLAMIRR